MFIVNFLLTLKTEGNVIIRIFKIGSGWECKIIFRFYSKNRNYLLGALRPKVAPTFNFKISSDDFTFGPNPLIHGFQLPNIQSSV